jgi:PPIC-type peptidyl-prolyl cis-trans isomerase-like protein
MRRLGWAVLVLALGGCEPLRQAFSTHAVVVATAAGQDLTVEQFAEWVGRSSKVPLRLDALTGLANVYVDHMLFAAALAQRKNLHDSLLVLAASWPAISQVKWERFHARLLEPRARLSPPQVDSAYRAGGVRLFQHILLQLPPSAAATQEQAKRTQLERLRREIAAQGGASFAQFARRYSEDPGSKSSGGYLVASPRGQLVTAFETPAWELEPGDMSGVVRSPFGLHLIRRPPLGEVRDSFRLGLETTLMALLDSIYVDHLTAKRQPKVADGAPALVRQAVQDLVAARKDTRTLVSYRDGVLRVKDLARWLFALDPNDVRAIPGASDDQLRRFLKLVTQQHLLIQQADSAGVRLTPDDWRQLRTEHDSTLATLERVLAVTPELLEDSAATPADRMRLAAARVNAYLGNAFQDSAQFYAVPPFLAEALRAELPWSVSPGGIGRVLERAQTVRATVDAARRARPPLRPAPGPPPIPVDTPRAPAGGAR